ncbi:hypothetical protein KUF83_30420 [Streptomyces sp. BV286]|uniref:hypothetical protein n=1 Tax=Streptomyces sp. BV286 TaxID=2849672 RepID=UPI001C2E7F3D|nr:hypothetical protein [Streptomyces sp. BV286]MBV1940852.1 hypothetical protein [Streptomyces sp. BV286]
MTLFEFPELMTVMGEVQTGRQKVSSMQQVASLPWEAIPATAWRHVVRKVKASLYYDAGAICVFCADLSPGGVSCSATPRCGPVRLSIWPGLGAQRYPLTDDLLTSYSGFDRLRLIATTSDLLGPYAQREVMATSWVRTDPMKRHALMQEIVGELDRSVPTAPVRTFIWDGQREIAYPSAWFEA